MKSDSLFLGGKLVVAVASFDSFIKTAGILLRSCEKAGATTGLLIAELPRRAPSRAQIESSGVSTQPEFCDFDEAYKNELVLRADVLLVMMDGGRSKRLISRITAAFNAAGAALPILVSAYPGIVFREHINGFMDRSPVDLLCLNSAHDFGLYLQAAGELGIDPSNAIVSGLPLLWDIENVPVNAGGAIVFFEQPSVPPLPIQREFLIEGLLRLARTFPERSIILKTRAKPGEATLHRSRGDLVEILARVKDLPTNISVSHAATKDILRDTALALTVSSTAAVEAMAYGTPVRILTDLGLNETLGNQFFIGSGTLSSFDEIIESKSLDNRTNTQWLKDVARPDHPEAIFLNALCQKLSCRPERSLTPGWGTQNWLEHLQTRDNTHRRSRSHYVRSKLDRLRRAFFKYI